MMQETPPFDYVYLNLENHPRGNLILQSLLNAGMAPRLIIQEASTRAQEGREFTLAFYDDPPPTTETLARRYQIDCITVADLNGDDAVKQLHQSNPAYIVLGDTPVFKSGVLNAPRIGIINPHPGYLPMTRGSHPYIWAVLRALPQGAACHFIDENVDTGPLICRQEYLPPVGISFRQMIVELNTLCAQLMVESVQKAIASYPQRPPTFSQGDGGHTFRMANPTQIQQAIKCFEQQVQAS